MAPAPAKDREHAVCSGDGGSVQTVWSVSPQIDLDNWVASDHKKGHWVGEREGERV